MVPMPMGALFGAAPAGAGPRIRVVTRLGAGGSRQRRPPEPVQRRYSGFPTAFHPRRLGLTLHQRHFSLSGFFDYLQRIYLCAQSSHPAPANNAGGASDYHPASIWVQYWKRVVRCAIVLGMPR